MATYQFGVVSDFSGTDYGLVQSFSQNIQSQEAVARDEDGNTVEATYYDATSDATLECIYDTTQTLPDIDDVITITGGILAGSFYVTGISINESNTDYTRVTLTVKRFVTNSVPAAVTT